MLREATTWERTLSFFSAICHTNVALIDTMRGAIKFQTLSEQNMVTNEDYGPIASLKFMSNLECMEYGKSYQPTTSSVTDEL
jgi:hypothetical protein